MTGSTAVAERPNTAVAKPIDSVRAALEKMKPQFSMALPKHLTPDRLLRVALTAIQNTPKLLECDRTSLYSAIMTCAQLGLEPDGVLGQAYLIPFGNKVQFVPGYKGLISLARNSGEVLSIQAHEVRERDKFVYRFGLKAELDHIPASGDRGTITHFWAMAQFKDGGNHWDVMSKAEVDAIRDGSQGYQSAKRFAKNGVINSPWETHYAEMGKKTAIRRIAKYLPMSVQKAAALVDAYDTGRHGVIDTHGEIILDQEGAQVGADAAKQIEASKTALDRFESDGDQADPQAGDEAGETADPPAAQPTGLWLDPTINPKTKTVDGKDYEDRLRALLAANPTRAQDIHLANKPTFDRIAKEDGVRFETLTGMLAAAAEGEAGGEAGGKEAA